MDKKGPGAIRGLGSFDGSCNPQPRFCRIGFWPCWRHSSPCLRNLAASSDMPTKSAKRAIQRIRVMVAERMTHSRCSSRRVGRRVSQFS
jgi:hypothetical protein